MALSEHLQIDGEHQRAAFGGSGALDQRTHEAAVLHDIELEPERLVDRSGDVLDRADRQRAHGVWNACRLRGAAGQNFAVAAFQTGHRHRPQCERQRHFLAQDGGRRVTREYVQHHALAQIDALEILPVLAQRILRIGAGFGVVEERLAGPGGGRGAAGPRCRSRYSRTSIFPARRPGQHSGFDGRTNGLPADCEAGRRPWRNACRGLRVNARAPAVRTATAGGHPWEFQTTP